MPHQIRRLGVPALLIAATATLGAATAATAQEVDAPQAPAAQAERRPTVVVQRGAGPQIFRVAPAEVRPQTYVGLITRPLPADLAGHLGLPEGVGLVIDSVSPDSPAAQAGIEPRDVLHRLDDQLIVNAPQLTTLVRMRNEGDVATLTIIRRGEPRQIEVTLAQTDLPVQAEPFGQQWFGRGGPNDPRAMQVVPALRPEDLQPNVFRVAPFGEEGFARDMEQLAQRLGEAMGNVEALDADALRERLQAQQAEIRQLMDQMRDRQGRLRLELRDLRPELLVPGERRMSQVTVNAADGLVTRLVNADGEVRLHLRDREGKVLWDGPFPSEEEIGGLPEETQEHVRGMRRFLNEENGLAVPDDVGIAPAVPVPAGPGGREQVPA